MKRALRYLSCTSLILFVTINVLFQCIFNDYPKLYQNNKPPIIESDRLHSCTLSFSTDGSGIIRFVFPKNTQAVIRLYNMLGTHIRTLAPGNLYSGNYQIILSRYNLQSGIYFVSVETPSCRFVKKVLLLK